MTRPFPPQPGPARTVRPDDGPPRAGCRTLRRRGTRPARPRAPDVRGPGPPPPGAPAPRPPPAGSGRPTPPRPPPGPPCHAGKATNCAPPPRKETKKKTKEGGGGGGGRQERGPGAVRRGLSGRSARPGRRGMCPAFGSLRGRRCGMSVRTATLVAHSGSACCGLRPALTLSPQHFYVCPADRRLRAVQFRDAGHRQAVRGNPRCRPRALRTRRSYDAVVVTNPSACRPRRGAAPPLLPKDINGGPDHPASTCRASACDHAEAKERAGRGDAELCPAGGPSRVRSPRPRGGPSDRPDGDAGRRRVFPGPTPGRGNRHDAWSRVGLAAGPGGGADPRVARALLPRSALRPRSRGGGGGPPPPADSIPFIPPRSREFEASGRPIVGSAPVGRDGTAAWLDPIGDTLRRGARSDRRRQKPLPAGRIDAALSAKSDQGPQSRCHGYEGLRTAGRPAPDRERGGGALRRHRVSEEKKKKPHPPPPPPPPP